MVYWRQRQGVSFHRCRDPAAEMPERMKIPGKTRGGCRKRKEKIMAEIRYNYEKEQNRVAAYDGSKCVGTCEYTAPGSIWIITHTKVDPAYGGQGIAGALVDGVMQEAKKVG